MHAYQTILSDHHFKTPLINENPTHLLNELENLKIIKQPKMEQIKVGAGVTIWQKGKVLLGYRLSKHGNGVWSFPGGHVEFGEHPDQAVIREAFEETGLQISSVEKLTFTSDFYDNGTQYLTLFFNAQSWSGSLENKEPEKCDSWVWFSPDALPSPLFIPIVTFLKERNLLKETASDSSNYK